MSTRYYPLNEYLNIFEQQFAKFLNLTNLVNGYKDNIEEFFKRYSKHIYNVIFTDTYLFRTSSITNIEHKIDKLIIKIEFDITDVLRKIGPYEFAYKIDDNMIVQINKRSKGFISVTDLRYIYEEYISFTPEIILRNGLVVNIIMDTEFFNYDLVSKGKLLNRADVIMVDFVIHGYDFDLSEIKFDEILYRVQHFRKTQIPYIPLDKISENIQTKIYGIPSIEIDDFVETMRNLIDTYTKQTNIKLNKFEYCESFDCISCRFSDSEFDYTITAFVEV